MKFARAPAINHKIVFLFDGKFNLNDLKKVCSGQREIYDVALNIYFAYLLLICNHFGFGCFLFYFIYLFSFGSPTAFHR